MLQANLQAIRQAIRSNTYLDEAESVEYMLSTNPLSEEARSRAVSYTHLTLPTSDLV